jgi:excisionase family DNA binding protein
METADAKELVADGAMGVKAAQAFTGLSRAELYKLMAAGTLPYLKHGTRRLVPKKALVDLLAKDMTERPVPRPKGK